MEKHPTLALLSATIAYNQGDKLKALESAKKLIDRLPNHTPSRLLLARIYTDLGHPADVIATLEPVYYRNENNAEFLSLYGRAQLQLERYQSAVESLERAAALGNNARPVLSDLALARIAMGNPGKAVEELQTAFEEGSNDTRSGVLLA